MIVPELSRTIPLTPTNANTMNEALYVVFQMLKQNNQYEGNALCQTKQLRS